MIMLRRQASDFARSYVLTAYHPQVPAAFKAAAAAAASSSSSSSVSVTVPAGAATPSEVLVPTVAGGSLLSTMAAGLGNLLGASSSSSSSSSLKFVRDGVPLKIVIYSRGSSGKGRSMQGEDLLLKGLQEEGAAVVMCCDFERTSLEDQLSFALHADVVRTLLLRSFLHL